MKLDEDNNKMHFHYAGRKCVKRNRVVQDSGRWRVVVGMVMKMRVLRTAVRRQFVDCVDCWVLVNNLANDI